MAQHSVKIEDKLWVKLKTYCEINNTTAVKISNEAIEKYLNELKFGDAPFLKWEHGENRQNYQEPAVDLEKNTEKPPKELIIQTIEADDKGNVHVKAVPTIDHIEVNCTIEEQTEVKPKVEQLPRKRRL